VGVKGRLVSEPPVSSTATLLIYREDDVAPVFFGAKVVVVTASTKQ